MHLLQEDDIIKSERARYKTVPQAVIFPLMEMEIEMEMYLKRSWTVGWNNACTDNKSL